MADGTLLAIIVALVSPLIAAGALFLGWKKASEERDRHDKAVRDAALQREIEALRLGDVLAWVNEAIHELQSLVIICRLNAEELDKAQTKDKLLDITFNTSILCERGRLFFKNDDSNYRPKVLDQLVIAFEVARGWITAN
jgi:hypothetical protein